MTSCIRLSLLLALLSAAGCVSHDYANTELLGAATQHNMALQSVRELDAPNMQGVDGGHGGRAGQPVSKLRNGEAEDLSPMSGS